MKHTYTCVYQQAYILICVPSYGQWAKQQNWCRKFVLFINLRQKDMALKLSNLLTSSRHTKRYSRIWTVINFANGPRGHITVLGLINFFQFLKAFCILVGLKYHLSFNCYIRERIFQKSNIVLQEKLLRQDVDCKRFVTDGLDEIIYALSNTISNDTQVGMV